MFTLHPTGLLINITGATVRHGVVQFAVLCSHSVMQTAAIKKMRRVDDSASCTVRSH